MSYCLNPNCLSPQNPDDAEHCQRCQSRLLLNDRYRPLEPIGRGGFGKTFKAIDEYKPSKPNCVIKQFHGKGFDDAAKAEELFHREAALQENLGKHPQIPELLALCPQDNYLYLVQEFIDGRNLNQELKEERTFSEEKVWQLLKDLLPVLQFVHANQVIHRDIKPENIMRHRADNTLFLVDFGIAKLATEAILAKTGTVIGSDGYTAPEQHDGKPRFASDLYSLGATCYHLLTYAGPSRLLHRDVDWQKEIRDKLKIREISDELIDVLTKLLQPDISQRYQSAEEVLEALVIQQTEAPSDHLTSAVGIDYSRLRDLLAAKNWKEADEETISVMLQVAGQEKEGCLEVEDIENFPCIDLRTIDQLWVKYSNERFGFTVQKRIWQSVGGTNNHDAQVECRFGERVGWRIGGWWSFTLTNPLPTLEAPEGYFPDWWMVSGWNMQYLGDDWRGFCLFSRIETCGL
jgi:serine/threonine protein kinase